MFTRPQKIVRCWLFCPLNGLPLAIACIALLVPLAGFPAAGRSTDWLPVLQPQEEAGDNSKNAKNEPADSEPDSIESVPVTAEEQAMVSKLIGQLSSDGYLVRVQAFRQLVKLDVRLEEILPTIEQPKVLEARVQLDKVLKQIGNGSLLNFQWRLQTYFEPEADKRFDSIEVVTFFSDGTFTDGDEQGVPEQWTYDADTKQIRLSFNGDYSVYTGKLETEGVFVGEAKNIAKQKWKFRMKIIMPGAED